MENVRVYNNKGELVEVIKVNTTADIILISEINSGRFITEKGVKLAAVPSDWAIFIEKKE